MSLNPETIVQIQAMMQAEPALQAQLQAETELAGAAAVIAKAAAAQGLDIAEADLMGTWKRNNCALKPLPCLTQSLSKLRAGC